MELMSVMELIGTVAFAASGAIVAIQKNLDYFGIGFLAITPSSTRICRLHWQIPFSLSSAS